jgi:NAD(P)-dependent dehydrogenase (short-subunit alcohol dehydrogenase family)
MFTWERKVAIVTGSGAGIGAATASTLALLGAAVVLADINEDAAHRQADQINGAGGRALACRTDVSKEADVAACVAAAVEHFGRLDILHNNAAAIGLAHSDRGLLDQTVEHWEATFRVNVLGVMLGCKHAVPAMLKAGNGGSIINTSSIAAQAGDVMLTAYGASKGAVSQLTLAVATQFGKDGIRCNAVAPGLTFSDTTAAAIPQPIIDAWIAHACTPHAGHPQDIANVVAFLASDEARYVTGQVLKADGGYMSSFPYVPEVREFLASQPHPVAT